jgi:hypothetical protein
MMREPSAPTLEELLAEVERISPPSPGGKTIGEWREVWGINITRTREIIHHAIRTGRMTTAPAYRPDVIRTGRRVQVWLCTFVSKTKQRRG